MNPYLLGKISALQKFAELNPLLKAVLEHAAAGAAPGAAMGGVTGAIAAPEGKRLQGAGQGALAGGLVGGGIGAGGRALMGRTLSARPDLAQAVRNPATGKIVGPVMGNPPGQGLAGLGEALSMLGAGGTGALAGGVGGAMAAPNEDTMWEKLKGKLGLG